MNDLTFKKKQNKQKTENSCYLQFQIVNRGKWYTPEMVGFKYEEGLKRKCGMYNVIQNSRQYNKTSKDGWLIKKLERGQKKRGREG